MKRIIAFSLYGSAPIYLRGAVINARLQRQVYPGWTCRFYCSQEIPEALIEELRAEGAEIVRKHRSHELDGMFWRFLPAGEPGLDALIVRDTDSRLTEREAAAVRDWLASGRPFHILRDHPHHVAPILGGLWGCRGGTVPGMMRQIARWSAFDQKGRDQEFLFRVVYPRVWHKAMIHSELVRYVGESVLPFPLPREGVEHVGAVFNEFDAVPPICIDVRSELLAGEMRTYPLPTSRLRAAVIRLASRFR